MRSASLRAVATAILVLVQAVPAAAGGANTFEPAQVVARLKREVAAGSGAAAESSGLRIEEVHVELVLVEASGDGGRRLLVPAADFGAGGKNGGRSPLKRRIVVDLVPPGAIDAEPDLRPSALGQTIAELRRTLRAGADAPPTFEIKRAGIDLEFVLEREPGGGPRPVVHAGGRAVEPGNVHKLRLRLSAKER
jgi:hypothetical protein